MVQGVPAETMGQPQMTRGHSSHRSTGRRSRQARPARHASGAGPRPPSSKLMTLSKLLFALRPARRAGRTIVFTNGVFDLLHPGHVKLLARAREMGDLLVVGVNSNASVRRLKGPDRPFVSLRDRELMLASLEAVDYVVSFTQDTPLRLIERIQPDLLVKGGDWKSGAIVGKDLVESRGGRVVRVPVLEGFSTTKIARSVRARRQV